MMNPSKEIFCYVLVIVLFVSHPLLTISHEAENEKEFEYTEGSAKGPEHWGDIHKEWSACKNGDMQSPIDLMNKRVEIVGHLGSLKRRYKPCNATLKNRGHDIMLEWAGDAGSININGTDFVIKQCHWHSPSEHTIEGKNFDLEVHLVHESLDKKTAVIGILYKTGKPDELLSKLTGHLRSIANSHGKETAVGVITPRHFKMGSGKYYRYLGSLTVPPCTEGVVWTIVKKVRTVSKEQLSLLREAVHDYTERNARPLQPINQRAVYLYNRKVNRDSGLP